MSNIIKLIFALLLASVSQTAAAQDPLPSWNDGIAKKAIVEFVTKVTAEARRILYCQLSALPPSTTTAHFGSSNQCILSSHLHSIA